VPKDEGGGFDIWGGSLRKNLYVIYIDEQKKKKLERKLLTSARMGLH